MTPFEAIKIKALYSVLKPDSGYYIRKLSRWYSRTYHTPLSDVYDLPIEYLLQNFYEETFEGLDEDELNEELREVVETPEQKKERVTAEELERLSEFQLLKMGQETNTKNIPKTLNLKDKLMGGKLTTAVSKLNETLKNVSDTLKEDMLNDPPELPPEIDIKFENNENFESLLNSDSNINSDKG